MYKEGDLNKEVMINSTTKILLGPSTRKNEKDLETWIKTKGISKESLVERRFAAYATLLKEIWFIPEESKTEDASPDDKEEKDNIVKVLIDKTGLGAEIIITDDEQKIIDEANGIHVIEVEGKELATLKKSG